MSSTIGSSIAAGASHQFAAYFDITNQLQLVLPTSSYLFGYVVGPLLFGPLSLTSSPSLRQRVRTGHSGYALVPAAHAA